MYADNEGLDQAARMRRLIWTFTVRIGWSTVHSVKNSDHQPEEQEEEEGTKKTHFHLERAI